MTSSVEKSLYIRILVWAYEQQEAGFTWPELEEKFKLTPEQKEWVLKVFRSNMPPAENLIDHIYSSQTDEHRYFITAKGTSAAVQYLNLKEAESSGRRAEKLAWVAIAIGVIVGIVEIVVQIYFR